MYAAVLWVEVIVKVINVVITSNIPTLKIPYGYTRTTYELFTPQTTVHRKIDWNYQNRTNPSQLQTSVFWCEMSEIYGCLYSIQPALGCTETAIRRYTAWQTFPYTTRHHTSADTLFHVHRSPTATRDSHGLTISVVVAEIMIRSIGEHTLATYRLTLPFWFRYVKDTITALSDGGIDHFQDHLSSQNCDIQFTKEIK